MPTDKLLRFSGEKVSCLAPDNPEVRRKPEERRNAVSADLAAQEGPQKLASQIRKIGDDGLDIEGANAGESKAATIEDTTGFRPSVHHQC